jgi:hypothetical protein
MLDFADKTLNQMPLVIAPGVVFMRFVGISPGRNHRFSTAGNDFIEKIARAIASIGNHLVKIQIDDQVMGLDDIVALSSHQVQVQRVAQTIDGDMRILARGIRGVNPPCASRQHLISAPARSTSAGFAQSEPVLMNRL